MKAIKTYTIELLFVVAVCLQSCLSVNEENFCLVTTLDAVITEEGITFKGKIDKKAFDEAGFVLQVEGRDQILIEIEDFYGGLMEVTLPFVYEYEDYWGEKRQINFQGQSIKYSAFVSDDWDKEYGVQKELFVPIITSMDYVDLGLSVKWATCNVGATKPEEYGLYFAWGETAPKEEFHWSNYKWCSDGYAEDLTKYYGILDGKIFLDPEDDAVAVNMGNNWRMPTVEELQELIDECTWTWTYDYNGTGVAGQIATSKINGNSIFLPAAGYMYGGSLTEKSEYGYYWLNSLYEDYQLNAHNIYFYSEYVGRDYNYPRFCGFPVRGVRF